MKLKETTNIILQKPTKCLLMHYKYKDWFFCGSKEMDDNNYLKRQYHAKYKLSEYVYLPYINLKKLFINNNSELFKGYDKRTSFFKYLKSHDLYDSFHEFYTQITAFYYYSIFESCGINQALATKEQYNEFSSLINELYEKTKNYIDNLLTVVAIYKDGIYNTISFGLDSGELYIYFDPQSRKPDTCKLITINDSLHINPSLTLSVSNCLFIIRRPAPLFLEDDVSEFSKEGLVQIECFSNGIERHNYLTDPLVVEALFVLERLLSVIDDVTKTVHENYNDPDVRRTFVDYIEQGNHKKPIVKVLTEISLEDFMPQEMFNFYNDKLSFQTMRSVDLLDDEMQFMTIVKNVDIQGVKNVVYSYNYEFAMYNPKTKTYLFKPIVKAPFNESVEQTIVGELCKQVSKYGASKTIVVDNLFDYLILEKAFQNQIQEQLVKIRIEKDINNFELHDLLLKESTFEEGVFEA